MSTSTLELTIDARKTLEILLRRAIAENALMVQRCPTIAPRVQKETTECEALLQQLILLPILSPSKPDAFKTKQPRVAECDRPKYRMA